MRQLPPELAAKGTEIVLDHARQAERAIVVGYPVGPTGTLRRRVTVERANSMQNSLSIAVRSRATHSILFEKGTVQRKTKKGYNRGRMPRPDEAKRMIPKAVR